METVPERLAAALADRYRVERELGAGGMATVYLAEDLKHSRRVAIKVLRPEVAAAVGAGRFEDEIRIVASLHHPHIVAVHDSGEADRYLYYVMPHVEGESLRDYLTRGETMSVPHAARLLVEVADALSYAHGKGIVHRDIKPENIMLSGRHAQVMDFGIAKAVHDAGERRSSTSLGLSLGTPAYMAPEQASGDPNLDQRADIYALGIVGYEILAGRPPFQGGSSQQILMAQLSTPPEPLGNLRPDLPPTMVAVIMRALAKAPGDRWQTAEAMRTQLEPLLNHSSGNTPTTAVLPAAQSQGSKRGVLVALAVVGLALAAGGWYWTQRRGEPPAPAPTVATNAAAPGAAASAAASADASGIPDLAKDPSIAVLPFENMSSDKEQDYFSDGVTEELLNLLAKVPKLRVIARTSSFSYKGKDVGVAQIARELHVAAVLEGSVRKSGDTVRITVQLIRARDGTHLWSEAYDRKIDDIFKVQDEIAQAVVSKLQGTLLGETVAPVARPVDARVYPQLLRAQALLNTTSKDARDEAIKLLKASLAVTPNEPRAWLALARAYINAAPTEDGDAAKQKSFALSREAAEHALALDPGLGVAHTYLGRLDVVQERGLQSAADHYARALQLEPANPAVLGNATVMLGTLGRTDAVLAIRRWLVDHDPANPIMQTNYCKVLAMAGHYKAAVPACEAALALSPDSEQLHAYTSDAYLNTGRLPQALKQAQLEPDELDRNVQLALVYHAMGREKDADAALATVKDNPDYTADVAAIAAYRGDADTAFAYIEKTYAANPTSAKGIVQSAYLQRLREDPRWLPLLRKMGVDPETLGKIRFEVTLPEGGA